MSPPALVFDLDGTLVESAPSLHAAAARLLAAEGIAPLPLAAVRSFIGDGLPMLVTRIMAAVGLPPEPALHERLLRAFEADYGADPVTLTEPMPGAVEAVRTLRDAGCAIGLCTNKPESPARAILAALGLLDAFDAVVGGDTLPVRKPDPVVLRLAHDRLGGGPCLSVGDGEVDAEMAQAAGMPLLLFTQGYRRGPVAGLPHAAAFDHFAELPGLVLGGVVAGLEVRSPRR